MNKKRIITISLILSLALLLAFLGIWMAKNSEKVGSVAGSIAEEKATDSVQLYVFSSKVEILVPGETDWKEGLDGDEIIAGTRVRTNKTGRGEIRFPGGGVTRIDHESEIVVEILDTKESNFVISLSRGKIWSRVSKLLGRVSYETKTGRTVATVRGTEYGHETHEDHDRIVVAESKVDVKCVGDDPNTLVVDVQISDWNCGTDGSPDIKESSIEELMEDEWYRFNLQNEDQESGAPEPIKVLGVTDESAYVPTPRPTTYSNIIECVGPDGGVARSTKQECDELWKYWNANPPPPLPLVDMGGSVKTSTNTSSTPTQTPTPTPMPTTAPTPTPVPISVTGATCLNDGCFKLAVTGSGFGSGIRLIAKDASSPSVATEGVVNVLDANNMEVDYGTAYSLCYSGQQPYNLSVFYVVGSEFVYPAFVPDFCSILF